MNSYSLFIHHMNSTGTGTRMFPMQKVGERMQQQRLFGKDYSLVQTPRPNPLLLLRRHCLQCHPCCVHVHIHVLHHTSTPFLTDVAAVQSQAYVTPSRYDRVSSTPCTLAIHSNPYPWRPPLTTTLKVQTIMQRSLGWHHRPIPVPKS